MNALTDNPPEHHDLRQPESDLTQIAVRRAMSDPDRIAYTFLVDGELEAVSLTYAELDRRARATAATLQQLHLGGSPILVLLAPGLDFIIGLMACLYAGAIAVPCYRPARGRNQRGLERLRAISENAGVTAALVDSDDSSELGRWLDRAPELRRIRWLTMPGTGRADDWVRPTLDPDAAAVLQYTSGSTATPKGVVITHRNLLHNALVMKELCQFGPSSRGVYWLPPYHDMGLLGGIVEPLYAGFPSTLMSPLHFVQRPARWLEAISRTRATISGGPNFAFDLCCRKLSEAERASLDLSSWQLAFNGAEPVLLDTLERFAALFGPCGFRREAYYPCYGLAESTLLSTGAALGRAPRARWFNRAALSRGEVRPAPADAADARALISCGRPHRDMRLAIVDPETRQACSDGRPGEIWLRGPSVSPGYWRDSERTAEAYAHIAGAELDGAPYLRTGDIGLLEDGELYVVGRLKDVVIIRGQNHHPADIEQTLAASHALATNQQSAVFSVPDERGEEVLCVVQEIAPRDRSEASALAPELFRVMRDRITAEHDVVPAVICLVRQGTIQKTVSGKVQRYLCKGAYLRGELQPLAIWRAPTGRGQVESSSDAGTSRSREEIEGWLTREIAERLSIDPLSLDVSTPFSELGMDSASAIMITGELSRWMNRKLSPALAWDYPTIQQLAEHLAQP